MRDAASRGHRARALILAALALFGLGCGAAAPPPATPAPRDGLPGVKPAWLPGYSPAQLAILAPSRDPMQDRARPVYPSLERFAYADNRILGDPREAVRVTQLVAEAVERSAHTYALEDVAPALANTAAQYGPPGAPEPDNYSVAAVLPGGEPTLVAEPAATEARAFLHAAADEEKAGQAAEAEKHLRESVTRYPNLPAAHLALAEFLARRNARDTEAAYRAALRVDPTLSAAHLGIARVLEARRDLTGARLSLAHALAYHPKSATANAMIAKLTLGEPSRPAPYAVFYEVDPRGVIHVGSAPTDGARMYAGCRAVVRYEPELREVLFNVPRTAPYFLSALEEMLCIESAIGAYLVARMSAREGGGPTPEDPQAQGMMRIAHQTGLLGFVMFEIIGQHRPERARLAPPEVHRAMVDYVLQFVLGFDPEAAPRSLAGVDGRGRAATSLAMEHVLVGPAPR